MRANGGFILGVNKMKKIISIALTMILIVGLFSFIGSAQTKYDYWEHWISFYEGNEASVILPERLENGERIVGISDKVFSDTKIEKVYMPDGYRWIGADAFAYCGSLRTVRLPATLVVIEPTAFYDCYNLNELWLPKNLWAIGDHAFGFQLGSDGECIDPYSVNPNFRAYVYSNSVAQKYCAESGIEYIEIDKEFDLNSDGEVDITDAMILFYHVAKKSPMDSDIGDLNHDGEIDISDAMILLYYVAKKV